MAGNLEGKQEKNETREGEREREREVAMSDSWTREYSQVKNASDEVYELIRERNAAASGTQTSSETGPQTTADVHKLSAHCRRKLQALSTKITSLERNLESEGKNGLTQRE